MVYPHENLPVDEQELLAVLTEDVDETPRVANVEICLRVSGLPHEGQTGAWSCSDMRTIFSNG
jgi:hypothetical protein